MKAYLQESEEISSNFPCLRENRIVGEHEQYIVYFIAPTVGFVIFARPESPYIEGHFDREWVHYNDDNIWEEFHGKVILES